MISGDLSLTTVSEIAEASPKGTSIGPFGSDLRANLYTTFGVPVVRGQDITDTKFLDESTMPFVSVETAHRLRPCLVKPGDLVFPHRGAIGRVGIALDKEYLLSSSMMRLRCDKTKADPLFVFYYFRGPGKEELLNRASTVGTPGIGQPLRSLRGIPLLLPPLPRQRDIARTLGALDDKIVANTQLTRAVRALAHAIFDRALASRGSSWHALIDLGAMLVRGITPAYTEAKDGVVVLNQKCVRNQTVDSTHSRCSNPARARAEKMLRINDVLVNSTGQGTLGRTARWTSPRSATVDSHITIVRFDPQVVDPAVAGYAMLSLQSAIEALGEGSTGQTELSRSNLCKLPLAIPSWDLQSELGRKLAQLDELENSYRRESDGLARLRDTLLPQLMSGKLRVRDVYNQVAGVR